MERIIKAADEIVDRVEESINLLMSMTAGNSSIGIGSEEPASTTTKGEDDFFISEDDEDDLEFLEDEHDFGGSPLDGIAKEVMDGIFSKNVGPQNMREHFDAFRSAINWKEPFIFCLLGFHFMVFITAFYLSFSSGAKSNNLRVNNLFFYGRMIFLSVIACIVYFAENINDYGRENWEKFATQDYFDKGGIFIGLMVCTPLLLLCLVLMLAYVKEATNLIVEVKKLKMKHDKNSKNEKTKSGKKGKKKTQ